MDRRRRAHLAVGLLVASFVVAAVAAVVGWVAVTNGYSWGVIPAVVGTNLILFGGFGVIRERRSNRTRPTSSS